MNQIQLMVLKKYYKVLIVWITLLLTFIFVVVYGKSVGDELRKKADDAAYELGREAYYSEVQSSANPYDNEHERVIWLKGWMDAKNNLIR